MQMHSDKRLNLTNFKSWAPPQMIFGNCGHVIVTSKTSTNLVHSYVNLVPTCKNLLYVVMVMVVVVVVVVTPLYPIVLERCRTMLK